MPNSLRFWLAALVILTGLAFSTASAQEATPAPTKTATPAPDLGIQTTPVASSGEFEALTQADLSVLTGNVQRPNGIAWFNNKLYTACTGDQTVYEIDSVTGSTITYIWGIRNAHTLYAEGEANRLTLWVPDYQSNVLARITPQRGAVETVASELEGPWGIAPLGEGGFLITSLLAGSVQSISREGIVTPVITELDAPTGITHDGAYLYVANNGSTRRAIEWYPLDSAANPAGASNESGILVSGVQSTTGIQMGADGLLYFAYSLGTRGVVGRVDPNFCRENGGCTNEQVEIVLYTELAAPLAGLTLSPDMRLFVHTMFSPEIYWAQIMG